MFTGYIRETSKSLTLKIITGCLAVLFAVILAPGLFGIAGQALAAGSCTDTARAAFVACQAEADDDYYIALGNCFNLTEETDRDECLNKAEEDLAEAEELCPEQRAARIDICETLGEDPYDPEIAPDNFVNPLKIGKSISPNPYFPLVPGTVRKYIVQDRDGQVIEKIKVEVLRETKEILGVTCIVVRDRVWEIDEDGEKSLIEDTFDWIAQDRWGKVWYFGEISKEFEDGELIGLEGSWKAGRDHAKPGILMEAHPVAGDLYRQEFALGEAEDMAEVVDFLGSVVVRGKNYRRVLQTRDFTPIDPDVYELKYYAPGVGVILEEGFDGDEPTGERVELVKIKIVGDRDEDDDDDDGHDRRRRH